MTAEKLLRHAQARIWWAMMIHSLSIIGFQVLLMRILEFTQWHHFAVLIIGLALLGFGVSGTFLSLFKSFVLKHALWIIPCSMVISSLFMMVALWWSQCSIFQFDSLLVFYSFKEFSRFCSFVFLHVIPFFFAATAVGALFAAHQQNVSILYSANLFGSGIGGVLALLSLSFVMPEQALVIMASFSFPAALLLVPHRWIIRGLFLVLFYLGLVVHWVVHPPISSVSTYKTLSKVLLLPDAKVVYRRSGIASSVHIVTSSYLRNAPGLSLYYQDSVPVQPLLLVNGNYSGFIPVGRESKLEVLDFTTQKLPYLFESGKKVLVVSGSSGMLVGHALHHGASSVVVFETNPDVIEALACWNPVNYPSIYKQGRVHLVSSTARSFLAVNRDSFDLVVLPSIGSFGGNSGLDALSENYSMTKEALHLFWNSLNHDGCLSVTVFMDYPPRAVLRTLDSFVQMLFDHGCLNVGNHLAAIRSWNDVTFLVSKTPFSDRQMASMDDFCLEMGFQSLLPIQPKDDTTVVHDSADSLLVAMTEAVLKRNRQEIDGYLFDISCLEDNRPYFSKYIKLSKLSSLLKIYPWHEIPYLEMGYVLLWSTVLVMLLLSTLFILIPVLGLRGYGGKTGVFFYFGSIGIGFMFLEIIMIQYFNHLFHQPLLSVTLVLGVLLMGSGMGSWFSSRLPSFGFYHRTVLMLLTGIIICYAFFLPGLLKLFLSYPFVIKVFICFVVVGLPSFFMGMPFPLALGSFRIRNLVPWAWGINGFFSVIATPVAFILAIECGFRMVLMVAGLFYFLAFCAVKLFYKQ